MGPRFSQSARKDLGALFRRGGSEAAIISSALRSSSDRSRGTRCEKLTPARAVAAAGVGGWGAAPIATLEQGNCNYSIDIPCTVMLSWAICIPRSSLPAHGARREGSRGMGSFWGGGPPKARSRTQPQRRALSVPLCLCGLLVFFTEIQSAESGAARFYSKCASARIATTATTYWGGGSRPSHLSRLQPRACRGAGGFARACKGKAKRLARPLLEMLY